MDQPTAKTTTWASDELSRIEAAQELEIAPRRRDGDRRRHHHAQARSTSLRIAPRAQL